MIDIKFLRENPDIVKENIRKKFQDSKLPLVDEVIELDAEVRKAQQEADDIRASRNKISKEIGTLMSQGKKAEAEAKKAEVAANASRLAELEEKENELREKIRKDMMTIPRMSRSKDTASLSCRISRSRTTRRSWRDFTGSIWTPRDVWRATASII